MAKILSALNTYIGNRQYFLRIVFFISALVAAYEGYTMPYLRADFQEVGHMRSFVVLMYLILTGLTFPNDWKKFQPLFLVSSLVMAIWINLLLLNNGLFDRMIVWLFLTLFAWGYIIEDIASFHYQHLFYFILTLIMLFFIDEPRDIKGGFLTFCIPFFITSYFILINLKKNKEQLLVLNSELHQKSQIFEKAQSIALMGNWEYDYSSQKLDCSSQLYTLFEGEKGQRLEIAAMLPLFTPEELAKIYPAIKACRKEGIPFDLKVSMKTFKGNDSFIRIAGFAERTNGRSSRLYGICQDLSADYLAGKELLEAKEAAEQASIAKSQFLSVMSHEIRTPMNAVIGSTHLLWEDNPREDQVDVLQTLHYSAENLLYLINDILDFSKIEAGGVELENVSFHLPQRISNIINTFSFQAKEKNIDLRAEILEPLPEWVKGDPTRLGQIITNLVGNALKFTEAGEVVVRVRRYKQEKNIHSIKIEVSDTGIGIPQDKLAHIFDQFTQAESNTTRKYGGTGLGLAISKKLLELMGSEIKVMSQLGKGTTFYFNIPLEVGEKVIEAPKEQNKQIRSPKALKILLAEDNLINIKIACKFLDKWGFTTTVVENGLDAVEKVTTEAFDLILMDLQMPKMGGIEATKEIRAKGYSVPIIALSAEVSDHIRERVIVAGMNDYSSKPFVPNDLKKKILAHAVDGRRKTVDG